MSEIILNLRENYPSHATYTVAGESIPVFPDLRDERARAVGTLAPGQHVSVEHVIILPEPLFPDWRIWGSLSTGGAPKYICLRQPMRNLPPKEFVFIQYRTRDTPISERELILLKVILEDTLDRLADRHTLNEKTLPMLSGRKRLFFSGTRLCSA